MDTAFSKLKILVVDDSPLYRRLVEQSLASEQFTLFFAKNGQEALNLFAEHRPAVVITDWNMPHFDGPELCKRIRRDFQAFYAYIILLTTSADKEKVIEGLAAGADDYLTKPFHSGELQARVKVGRRIADLHFQLHSKNRQLEELALTDSLTGLPNRRALELWANGQLSASARHNFPFWVALADLDHFKSINDTYGHDSGDAVLKEFAGILKSNTRKSNICGRLGGEEFVMIITHVEEKENISIAVERIRTKFESQAFVFAGQSFKATASFGIAGFRGTSALDFVELLSLADAALYSAKRKGRNRVEFAASA